MAENNGNRLFINRELSWLEFNRRVLDLSRDRDVPLGERLNFAAIYASNLDEFFMVRVGSLCDQTLLKAEMRENKTNMTPRQQLDAIMPKVGALQKICDKSVERLFEALGEVGLKKVDFTALNKEEEAFWHKYFQKELFPLLSPQIIDRRHPFPFLRDREIYVGAMIKDEKNKNPLLGLVPISGQFNRLITLSVAGEIRFALVEELVLHFANLAFGKANLLEKSLFRITRNADINVEEGMFDHDIDYREVMSELLKKRRRLSPVRLQFICHAAPRLKAFLLSKLDIPNGHSFVQQAPLELSVLQGLCRSLRRRAEAAVYFYPEVRPLPVPLGYKLYNHIRQRDVLLCYPYHSIRPFIQMLNDAAVDKDVISIKMTLYRVATDSKVIEALIAAAENGKEVVTVVELRARFDEQNNIDWSRQLEKAGCTVIYGFSDYKVHSKLTLITRKSGAKYEYISSVGTGNYNEKTSELYTDLAFFTCRQDIGEEVAAVFNNLAVERLTSNVNKLIVAPLCFKSVLLGEIDREIARQAGGGQGRVWIKCNSISDKDVIEKLSDASQAGVQAEMIVRGICCLQAGLAGISENIHVRSLVGRYLEHSRIYAFGMGEEQRIYIASGDFLTRNTERRVEVGVRIEDPAICKVLMDILMLELADDVNARLMRQNGSYAKPLKAKAGELVDSQMLLYPYFEKLAQEHMPGVEEQGPEEKTPGEKPTGQGAKARARRASRTAAQQAGTRPRARRRRRRY